MRTIFADLRKPRILDIPFFLKKAKVFEWLTEFEKFIVIIQNKKNLKKWSYMNEYIALKEIFRSL